MSLSEDIKLSKKRPVIIRGSAYDLICKRHLEECPRGKSLLDMVGMSRICILATGGIWSSRDKDVSYEHGRRGETQKCLRKNYYHRIKCNVTTFLAAFMWRRHLNSEILATTTHRKPREVSDGISTQVISQTIDKCKVKMI